jgi:phenylacetate-coenzyme A ligase PaaK-like adenylate-forming protein
VDSRERFQEVLKRYRFDPVEPGGDECWPPQLETASRGRLREIQSDKLVAAVAFLWDHSPLYRRLLEHEKLRPADIKSLDDLHKLPLVTREAFVESQRACPPGATTLPSRSRSGPGTDGCSSPPAVRRLRLVPSE